MICSRFVLNSKKTIDLKTKAYFKNTILFYPGQNMLDDSDGNAATAATKPLLPKTIDVQSEDYHANNFPRENRFWTAFISKLCPAFCASICALILALPYVIVPAVKGPGTEFCNGYWKHQPNAQFGGMVISFVADQHHLFITIVS